MYVNLTAGEFISGELIEVVEKTLAQEPELGPSRLKLAITETECMRQPGDAIERIKLLRELGVATFIDDFDTG